MHGYNHIYDTNTNKKDFSIMVVDLNFLDISIDVQLDKIKSGLQIFKENNINIRVFYAPNHTYDINTFEALKAAGINQVIDGYGLMPYKNNNIHFYSPAFL